MTPLGAKIRELREERGVSLKDMAAALNVSSAVRPKLRPATNADSTRTSNQLSIERDTNWYDTV